MGAETSIQIHGQQFYINNRPTYSDIQSGHGETRGLLMNARFVQGIYDDANGRRRYHRWKKGHFDPDRNTDDLIAALPEWYKYGLRAFTVCLQGGGPFFTIPNQEIDNNPFGADGKHLDQAYADRLDRLIKGADAVGMAVIVSYFYQGQACRLEDGRAVRDAVVTASRFLKEGGYANVLIEVANEYDNGGFRNHPLIQTPEGHVILMDLARKEAGGLPVSSSGNGGRVNKQICEASDYVLVHGNAQSRNEYYNMIQKAREWAPDKPIVCNEDSQAISQLDVAYDTYSSWGYYNNMTKQEPPADWGVTRGEDEFFAWRMAKGLGIDVPSIDLEDQFYLQGCEPEAEYDGKRWIRMASLYPERVHSVQFFCNDKLVYTAWDDPFMVNFKYNHYQTEWHVKPDDREWRAVVQLTTGEIIEKRAEVNCEAALA